MEREIDSSMGPVPPPLPSPGSAGGCHGHGDQNVDVGVEAEAVAGAMREPQNMHSRKAAEAAATMVKLANVAAHAGHGPTACLLRHSIGGAAAKATRHWSMAPWLALPPPEVAPTAAKACGSNTNLLAHVGRKLLASSYTMHGQDLGALFARYDTNGNDVLEADEMATALQKLVPGCLTREQVLQLVSAADTNGDGAVDVGEFIAFVKDEGLATQPVADEAITGPLNDGVPSSSSSAAAAPAALVAGSARSESTDSTRSRATSFFDDDEKRKCTDSFFCAFFVLFWLGILVLFGLARQTGDPARLLYATDYRGTTCGTADMLDRKLIYYPRLQEDIIAAFGGDAGAEDDALVAADVRFFGVCVDACPDAGTSVSDHHNRSWQVPLDSANFLFRCLAYNNVTTTRLARCILTEPRATGATRSAAAPGPQYPCGSVSNCRQVLLRQEPACVTARIDRATSTDMPARSNPVFDALATAGAVLTRWMGDLMLASAPILLCGGLVALLASLAYLFLLRRAAYRMVWFTVYATYALLLVITIVLCQYGGLLAADAGHTTLASVLGDDLAGSLTRDGAFVRFEDYGLPSSLEGARYYRYSAYAFLALDLVALVTLLYLRPRIGVAVGIIREASRAVRDMPMLLVVPFLLSLVSVCFMGAWLYIAAYISTAAELRSEQFTQLGLGGANSTAVTTIKFFATDNWAWKGLLYHFFGLLWTNQLIHSFSICVIAFAVSDWYWCADRAALLGTWYRRSLRRAIRTTLRYHLGSLAFGSLILACVSVLSGVLTYIDRRVKKLERYGACFKVVRCCLGCCLCCFRRCVQGISRQSFIVVALTGMSFCPSSRRVLKLTWKHLGQIGTVQIMSNFVLRLGKLCVTVVSCLSMLKLINDPPAMWFPIVGEIDPTDAASRNLAKVSSPVLPLVATIILSYTVASYCFSVYAMAIDTILLSFCTDLEENAKQGKPVYMEDSLRRFIAVEAVKFPQFDFGDGQEGEWKRAETTLSGDEGARKQAQSKAKRSLRAASGRNKQTRQPAVDQLPARVLEQRHALPQHRGDHNGGKRARRAAVDFGGFVGVLAELADSAFGGERVGNGGSGSGEALARLVESHLLVYAGGGALLPAGLSDDDVSRFTQDDALCALLGDAQPADAQPTTTEYRLVGEPAPAPAPATAPSAAAKWLLQRVREAPLQAKFAERERDAADGTVADAAGSDGVEDVPALPPAALATFNAAFDRMWHADGRPRYGAAARSAAGARLQQTASSSGGRRGVSLSSLRSGQMPTPAGTCAMREAVWPESHKTGLLSLVRTLFTSALWADKQGDADCELLAQKLRASTQLQHLLDVNGCKRRKRRRKHDRDEGEHWSYPQLDSVCDALEEQEDEGVTWSAVVELLRKSGLLVHEDHAQTEMLENFQHFDEMKRRKHSLHRFEQDGDGEQDEAAAGGVEETEEQEEDRKAQVVDDSIESDDAEADRVAAMIGSDDEAKDDVHVVFSEDESEDEQAESRAAVPLGERQRNNHWVACSMGYDMALVFPRRKGQNKSSNYSLHTFQVKMLGLKGEGANEHFDQSRMVLKTPRCMLSDDTQHNMYLRNTLGDAIMSSRSIASIQNKGKEDELMKQLKFVLRSDWVRHFGEKELEGRRGSRDGGDGGGGGAHDPLEELATCAQSFDEVVAKVICLRLQVACGLQTDMYKSMDGDEIICTVMADENDLRTEAARTSYELQVRLQPFSEKHKAEDSQWMKMHRDQYIRSIHHLSKTCDWANQVTPEMDPMLFKARVKGAKPDMLGLSNYRQRFNQDPEHFIHRKLVEEINSWGHNPAIDWDDVSWLSILKKKKTSRFKKLRRWFHELMHVSPGPHNYFAPYVEYKSEYKFQPYFRHYVARAPSKVIAHQMRKFNQSNYSMKGRNGTQYTIFRDIDRIRLTKSIIERHINVDAMVHYKMLARDMYGLHNFESKQTLKHTWALKFEWKELWGTRRTPLLEIRDYWGEKVRRTPRGSALHSVALRHTIGLYFAFLDYMTKMLVIPTVMGICAQIFALLSYRDNWTFSFGTKRISYQSTILMLFAVGLAVWSTAFTTLWMRKNALLNLWWGTYNYQQVETPRPQFVGTVRPNPISNQMEMWHVSQSAKRRKQKRNLLLVVVLLGCATYAVFWFMRLKNILMLLYGKLGASFAGILMAGQISSMNVVYKMLAKWLTTKENHRTESEFQSNMISKAFVFQFVNSYGAAIYIAFFKQHLDVLFLGTKHAVHNCSYDGYRLYLKDELKIDLHNSHRAQIYAANAFDRDQSTRVDQSKCTGCLLSPTTGAPDCLDELEFTLFIVITSRMVVQNVSEIVYPIFMSKLKVFQERKQLKALRKELHDAEGVAHGDEDKKGGGHAKKKKFKEGDYLLYEQAEYEAKLTVYGDLQFFDDYNEIVLLYGYVVLFAVAFPLAPLMAFMSSVAELHVDAYKMTHYGRPKPDKASDIGMWFYFLSVMSTVSVMTNSAIIIFSSVLLDEVSLSTKVVWFLIIENAMICVKRVWDYLIPDAPQKVQQIAKRYDRIHRVVFKGLDVVHDQSFTEEGEDVDLVIRDNPRNVQNIIGNRVTVYDGKAASRSMMRGKSYVQI
eukprot:g1535.t1